MAVEQRTVVLSKNKQNIITQYSTQHAGHVLLIMLCCSRCWPDHSGSCGRQTTRCCCLQRSCRRHTPDSHKPWRTTWGQTHLPLTVSGIIYFILVYILVDFHFGTQLVLSLTQRPEHHFTPHCSIWGRFCELCMKMVLINNFHILLYS